MYLKAKKYSTLNSKFSKINSTSESIINDVENAEGKTIENELTSP